ncbi:hypothetical protein CAPTEDRAFT_224974 [Capitella teleta]|uniref:C-type lectin domain-containing protein n=1 Tax=Capitella teleta TaxID=283909 RepID=R7ULC6_CAPTE|nr:hypothetical protein CAPTEDRAFT_224974 [Capitella teleta]|eukprot:ELU07015.1 hypothetical protein CAPTEDRAFT_224974 [Capitella teleta]
MERMATDLTLKVVCILVALGSIHSEVCPEGWFMWMNTTCYYLSPNTYTRLFENNSCHEMDSHLAHIESDDENKYLTELLKSDHITAAWIGLWKAKKDLHKTDCDLSCRRQGWTWSGNVSISSEMEPKWAQGEPSGGQSCARLKNTGEWWDAQCSHEYNYICEKPILHQPTPAAGTPDSPTTIEGNSESRQPQSTTTTSRAIDSTTRGNYTSMAPEGGSPNNLPIIIGAAVGGVLLGVLITGIVFIVVYSILRVGLGDTAAASYDVVLLRSRRSVGYWRFSCEWPREIVIHWHNGDADGSTVMVFSLVARRSRRLRW